MLIHRILYIGRWRCDFFFATGDGFDPASVMECLEYLEAPSEILERSWFKMQPGTFNEGFTWSNGQMLQSCIFVGPAVSGAEFLDSFTHELRHLADDIAANPGINLRGERVAYITGDTTRDLAEVVCRLGCPTCHD